MGFPRALVEALAAKLKADVPALAEVYPEWPEGNQTLVYPCLTVISGSPKYERCSPYLRTKGATVGTQATNLYVVGQFDIGIQLDIWTKYKLQRDTIYDLVWKVLEPVIDKGLVLTLAAYHGEVVGITQTGYKYLDTADSVMQKEWRVMVELVATCRAIATTQEYIITQTPVLVFDTSETIEIEE